MPIYIKRCYTCAKVSSIDDRDHCIRLEHSISLLETKFNRFMTKNIETADTIVKLILAVLVIAFYFSRVISGPLAQVLMFLAVIVLLIFVVKALLILVTRD
jgi:hypothetical protein